jgi:hypothetical protein
MTGRPGTRTEDELLSLDVPQLIAAGLPDPSSQAARWLFAEGAVAAAVRADQLGVQPRSLTFLAEIIRRGGIAYGAGLPEPLPLPEQSDLVRPWMVAALDVEADASVRFAHWLDAVAAIVAVRHDGAPGRSVNGR